MGVPILTDPERRRDVIQVSVAGFLGVLFIFVVIWGVAAIALFLDVKQ